MPKVLITGGTGLIGRHLSRKLKEKGYEVIHLSRSREPDGEIPSFYWDVRNHLIEKDALKDADYIVHLAGANIGSKRWTGRRKREILNSRVKSGEIIFEQVKKLVNKPEAFISASATGYYSTETAEDILDEQAAPSDGFLGQTCRAWEQIAEMFSEMGIRSVIIRTGIVLSKDVGALSKFILLVRLGLGAALGSGKQYMPWIHIDDLCGIYMQAIEERQMVGVFNAVAPEHLTNKEFTQYIAKTLRKPLWLPHIPAVIIKLIFGEMSVMLLNGNKISAGKITSAGYNFQFPEIESALISCIKS
jgi:uncharacterized protein (TIGR01777 family)